MLALDLPAPCPEVAARLGVPSPSFYKWVKAVTADGSEQASKDLLEARREMLRLRAQMRRIEEGRNPLKETVGYFARELGRRTAL